MNIYKHYNQQNFRLVTMLLMSIHTKNCYYRNNNNNNITRACSDLPDLRMMPNLYNLKQTPMIRLASKS